MQIYLDPKRNFSIYDIIGVFNSGATSIQVECASVDDIPDPSIEGMYDILVYNAQYAHPNMDVHKEYIRVGAMTWNGGVATLSNLLRGQEGTTAQDHNISNTIYRAIITWSKKDRDDINASLNTVMNSIGGKSMVFDEALTAGDIVKIINNGGPRAKKIVQNLSTPEIIIDLSVSISSVMATALSETKMAIVYLIGGVCNLGIFEIVDNGRQIIKRTLTNIPDAIPDDNYHTNFFIVSLNSTKVVLCWQANSTNYIKCEVIDVGADNNLTIGSVQLPFGSVSSSRCHIGIVSASRIVVVGETSGRAVVGDIVGRTITWGTVGSYGGGSGPMLAVLSATSFVVTYYATSLKAVVCTISGSSITAGTAVTVASAMAYRNNICALSSTKVVIIYSAVSTGYGNVVVGDISDTTITIQTPITFYSYNSEYSNYIMTLTSSSFVVSWSSVIDSLSRAQIGTVSGNDITMQGNPVVSHSYKTGYSRYNPIVVFSNSLVGIIVERYANVFNIANNILSNRKNVLLSNLPNTNSSVLKAFSISTSKFVVVLDSNGTIKSAVGTVSGDVVTIGTVASYSAQSSSSHADKLTNTSFIVCYQNSGNIYGLVATISGDTITFASPTLLLSDMNNVSVIALTSTIFVVVSYATSDGYGHAILGGINGTIVTLIGDYKFENTYSTSYPYILKLLDDAFLIAYYNLSDSKEYIILGLIRGGGLVFGTKKVLDNTGSNLPTSIAGVNIDSGKSVLFFNTTSLEPSGPKAVGCVITLYDSFLLNIGPKYVISDNSYVPTGITCEKVVKDRLVVGMTHPNGLNNYPPYEYYILKIDGYELKIISESIVASEDTFYTTSNSEARTAGIAILTNSIFVGLIAEAVNQPPNSSFLMCTVLQDDRSLATGIVQITGGSGVEEKISLASDISNVHAGLTIDETYFIDRFGNVVTTPTPWKLGRAISATEMKLLLGE